MIKKINYRLIEYGNIPFLIYYEVKMVIYIYITLLWIPKIRVQSDHDL